MLGDSSIIRPVPPTLLERLEQKVLKAVTKKQRKAINQKYHNNIINKNVTIVSSFCGGGTLYHDIGAKFLSPTINLAMDGPDFCTFCENLEHYLSGDLVEVKTEQVPYPVGRIEDVEIRFVHYKSFEEAKKKWYERAARVDLDNILIMAHDRDGMNDEACLKRFDQLKYPKVMFTAQSHPSYGWAKQVKRFNKRAYVGVLTGIADIQGRRFYEQAVDIVNLLNSIQK